MALASVVAAASKNCLCFPDFFIFYFFALAFVSCSVYIGRELRLVLKVAFSDLSACCFDLKKKKHKINPSNLLGSEVNQI